MTAEASEDLLFEPCRVSFIKDYVPKPGSRPRPSDLVITLEDGTVLDEAPTLISPSQCDQILACERKWAFRYIDGRKPPQTKAQIFGEEMHGELEGWLMGGTPPKSELLMTSGALAHFPPPRTEGLQAEGVFVFRVRRSRAREWVYFWGFTDAQLRTLVDVRTYDLKTTSDIESWAKVSLADIDDEAEERGSDGAQFYDETVAEVRAAGRLLDEDCQALVYSVAGMLDARRKHAHLVWVYVQTRGQKISKPVTLDLSWDQAARAFAEKPFVAAERILAGRELASQRTAEDQKRTGLTVLQFDANPRACGAYGGCPNRADCKDVTALDLLVSMHSQDRLKSKVKSTQTEKNKTMGSSLLSKLHAKIGTPSGGGTPITEVANASAATPAAASEKSAESAPPAGGKEPLAARLKRASKAAETAPPPAESPAVEAEKGGAGEAIVINGHDGTIVEGADKKWWHITVAGEAYKHVSREKVIELAKEAAPPKPPPPPPEPAKAARAPRSKKAADARAESSLGDGLVVLLDVLPVNGPAFPDLDEVLAPLQEMVAAAASVDHYQTIPFSDGPKALAADLARLLSSDEKPRGVYTACSKTLPAPVLEVLRREATIFKGVIW